MNRSRSRSSEAEEPSEDAVMEQELAHYQRKYRVMQNDFRAYREETKRVINKQGMLKESLASEREELDTCLAKMETTQNKSKDDYNANQLASLSRAEKEIGHLISEERTKAKVMDAEILALEKKIAEQRKKMGGTHTSTSRYIAIRKRQAVLENRLDKAMVQFNKQLASNMQLRSDIDHLRQERCVFDNLYKKLSRELEQTKLELAEVIETSTQAFEQRDEAQNKMMALEERNVKDANQHDIEMKELQRVISHDNKVKEFMMIKASDRAELKAEENAKKRDGNKAANVELSLIKSYEEAFEEIKKITQEDDINVIVNNFIHIEEENFALFNYVNELNNESETLADQLARIKCDISKFQEEDKCLDKEHKILMSQLEARYDKAHEEANLANKRLREINKVLEQLLDGVEGMFHKIGCDSAPIKAMLGGDSGISTKNIMIYLGLIEQKTSELLNIMYYFKSQRAKLDGTAASEKKEPVIVGSAKPVVPATINITAPAAGEDDDSEEEREEEELHPMSATELRLKVMKGIDRRMLNPTQPVPQKTKPAGKDKKKGGRKTH